MAFQLMYGVGLIVLMCAMVWIGRPARGQDVVPWLRNYAVGQLYVLTAFACGILGVTIIITNWP